MICQLLFIHVKVIGKYTTCSGFDFVVISLFQIGQKQMHTQKQYL
jgi:hypothetical protein